MSKYLIIGDCGYLGKNLKSILGLGDFDVYNRSNTPTDLEMKIANAEYIMHFAAVQRPLVNQNFGQNLELTERIIGEIKKHGGKKLIFTSSMNVFLANDFGKSKVAEENLIVNNIGDNIYQIYRLPNTYGPYGRANYNSVFATFVYAVKNSTGLSINNPNAIVGFKFIGHVLDEMLHRAQENVSFIKNLEPDVYFGLPKLLNTIIDVKNGVTEGVPNTLVSSIRFYLSND